MQLLQPYDISFRVVPSEPKPVDIHWTDWLEAKKPELMRELRNDAHKGTIRKFLRVESYRRAGENPPVRVRISNGGECRLFSVIPRGSSADEMLDAYDGFLAKLGWRVVK